MTKEHPSSKGWIIFTFLLLAYATILTEGHNQKKNIQRTYDYGYALKFDGSADYVSLPALSFGSPVSFEFLVRPRGNGGTILEFSDSNGRNGVRVSVISNYLNVLVINDKGNTASVTADDSLSNEKWHYVVITVSNTRTVSFYIERDSGDSDSSTKTLPSGFAPYSAYRTLNYIGKSRTTGSSNGARAFNGDLDEIRIWNKQLSSDEISAGRLRPLRGDEDGFLAFYDCNQASGLTLADITDNQLHGALGGNDVSKAPSWIVSGFAPSATCSMWGNFVKTFDKMPLLLSTTGIYWISNTTATSLDSVPDVLAQARITIRRKANVATVTPDGLAFQTSKDYVIFDFDLNTKSDTIVTWNGQQVTDPNFVGSTGISIVKTITNSRTNAHTIEFLVPFTFSGKITVSPNAGDTKIEVKLNESPFKNNDISGLCGNYNGYYWDDVGFPISQTWSVVGQSLFTGAYSFEDSISSFDCNVQDYPALYTASRPICENTTWVSSDLQSQCYYDVCVAGDLSGAIRTAEETYRDCLENSSNSGGSSLCNKPCPGFCSFHGQCINGQCLCTQPYIGKDCSQKASYPCFAASWPGEPEVILQPFTSTSSIGSHYRYNNPRYSSANTNNEIQDTTVVYIYQQLGTTSSAKNTSLVVINDLPLDESGGKASLSVTLTNAVGAPLRNVSIAVQDDSSDKYGTTSLNSGGLVTANWTWAECCTDGFALTNLPINSDFCAALTFSALQGITQGVVASRDLNGDQDLTSFPLDQTINICGKNCTNTCVQHTSCDTCMADTNCGWCSDSEVCVPGSAVGPDAGKCRSWRYSYTTSRMLTSEPGYPVDPSTLEYFLNSSSSPTFQATFSVRIPDNDDVPLEALILQDVSAAFASDLSLLRASIVQTFFRVVDIYPSAKLAVGSFSDKPLAPYGSPSLPDATYKIRTPLTADPAAIQAGLNALTVAAGGDEPNSQLEALLLAAKTTEVGWSSSARKVIILITKSSYHTPVNDSRLVDNNGDGESPNYGTTENYPSVSQVGSALLEQNIIPLFITTPALAPVYQNLVNQFGFGFVSSYTELNSQSIFAQTLDTLGDLSGTVRPIIYQQGDIVGSISPVQYTGVSAQTRVTFQVTLSDISTDDAIVVVPGFGSLTLTHVATDNPVADQNLDITVLSNDDVVLSLGGTSVYGDVLSTVITQLPNGLVFQYNGGSRGAQLTGQGPWSVSDPRGRVVYNANNQASTSTLRYYLKDSCAACSTFASFQISTSVAKSLPQAIPDSGTCNEDDQVTINLRGSSSKPATMVARVLSLPSGGQLFEGTTQIQSLPYDVLSGAVTYKPNANQHGADTNGFLYDQFTFTVYDSEGQAVQAAVISLYVLPMNDLPVTRDVSASGSEDQIVSFTLDASDVDGDALSYVIDSISSGSVCTGDAQSCSWSTAPFNSTNPTINFKAPADANGVFQIAYRALDGVGSSNVSHVTITLAAVNDLPVATAGSGSTDEDTQKQFTLSITDIDNTAAQVGPVICSWNGPGTLTDSTSAVIPYTNVPYNLPLGSNVVTFTPALNGNGSPYATFSFAARDSVGASTCGVTFQINVNAVNDAPQSFSDVVSVVESTPTNITLRGSDVDTSNLVFYLCSDATKGTLLNSDNSAINNAITGVSGQTASVKYTPVTFENGVNYASFSFKTFDGQYNSSCSTITINVAGVQNAPSTSGTTPSPISTNEDITLDVTLACTDPDNDPLTFKIEDPVPSSSQVVLGEVQTGLNITAGQLISGNKIRIQPYANWYGTTTFTYSCTDGNNTAVPSTVSVTVVSVNDPPIAFDQTAVTNENQVKVILLSGSDVETPTSLTFQIQYTVSRGTLEICSDQVCNTTTGTAANNSPVPSGAVKFTPDTYTNDNNTGVYTTFTFFANDGISPSLTPATVTIGVTPVNFPPVATTPNSTVSAPYNQDIVLFLSASDPDNDTPLLVYVSSVGLIGKLYQFNSSTGGRGNQIQGYNVTVTDSQYRVIYSTQTGSKSAADVDLITYVVSDPAGLTASGQLSVTLPNNTAPVANASPQYTIDEDTPITLNLTGVDLDDANNVFTAYIKDLPTRGSLYQSDGVTLINVTNTAVTDPNNQVIFVPALNENGDAYSSFSYYVHSQNTTQESLPATLTINVTPVNDLPIITVTSYSINERVYSQINLTAYDPDGDAIVYLLRYGSGGVLKFTYVNLNGSQGAALVYNLVGDANITHPYGTVGVQPVSGYYGLSIPNLRACDWSGCSSFVALLVTVVNVPDAPIVQDMRVQFSQPMLNGPGPIGFSVSDPDDFPTKVSVLTLFIVTLPQRGKLWRTITETAGTEVALNNTLDYPNGNVQVFFDPLSYLDWGSEFATFLYQVKDETNLYSRNATVHIDITAPCSEPAVFIQPGNGVWNFNVTAGSGPTLYQFQVNDTDPTDVYPVIKTQPANGILFTRGWNFQGDITQYPYEPLSPGPGYDNAQDLQIFTTEDNATNFYLYYQPNPGYSSYGTGPDCYQFQYFTCLFTAGLVLWPEVFTTCVYVVDVNTVPSITLAQSTFSSSSSGVTISGVSVADDSLNYNITVVLTGTNSQSVALVSSSGINYVQNTASKATITGTVTAINTALASGIQFVPTSTGSLLIQVNDNGYFSEQAQGPGTPLTANATISVTFTTTSSLSSGSAATGAFIGSTTIVSAAVYGVYRTLKSKKVIPEEADPWENDDAFDATADNPLYGTSGVTPIYSSSL